MPVGTYSAGDVLVARVPFTDASGAKNRPVLCVNTEGFNRATNAVIFVPVTSNPRPFGDYVRMEFAEGRLDRVSNIILDRLHTLEDVLVQSRVGRVAPALLARVLERVHRHIANPGAPRPDPDR